MLAILGATRAFVALSQREGWPVESPTDCTAVLDGMLASIINPDKYDPPEYSSIQFTVTGPIQEIAISNGWHDVYLRLAEEYDKLEKKLKLFQPGKLDGKRQNLKG